VVVLTSVSLRSSVALVVAVRASVVDLLTVGWDGCDAVVVAAAVVRVAPSFVVLVACRCCCRQSRLSRGWR
jgi:hypothetical protein